tara:strand:- start:5326 stop:7383 length:2058 start_codon:yes stop_codon:yes gene_type:complete
MEYLLKVSAIVAIFYVCYKLFLQRDTFFEHNRWFLLFGLVTSFLVPFFVIPNYIEYVPTEIAILSYENISVTNETEKAFNILDYFPLIYGLGVLCFLIRFLIQLSSLSVVIFKNENVKDGRYTFVKTNKNISPFSFFNWIVYNPTNFTKTDLDQIITHEKAHANQFHSIDILLTQLVNIVLWFNPIIWFYNKDLKQNLEFIADKTAQNKLKCKKSYQTILLKTSIPSHQMVLSNNFYNSLIKKRIVMLHKSKSKKINQIKFALVIPLLAIFLMSFNTKDIYIEKDAPTLESSIIDNTTSENNFESLIEETKSNISLEDDKSPSKPASVNSKIKKSVEKPISKVVQEKTEITIDKNTTDASLHKISASLKDKGIDSKFKSVKRNNQGEIIAIKINVSSKVSNANYNINSDEPIKPVLILIDNGGKNISIGNHSINNDSNEFVITGKISDNNGNYLPGTNIIIKNTKKGTVSNFDGFYKIKTKEGDALAFSFIGFDTKVVKVKSNDDINVILNESDKTVKLKNSKIDTNYVAIKTNSGKDPIYIIKGKVISEEEIKDIRPEEIESISVLKGEKAKTVYGEKGENGVVIIEKKTNNEVIIDLDNDDYLNEEGIIIIKENKNPSNVVIRGTSKKNKPLIIIDGKETKDKIEDLDSDEIKSINVLKGNSANKKYGKKGKNGVIEIITKKK